MPSYCVHSCDVCRGLLVSSAAADMQPYTLLTLKKHRVKQRQPKVVKQRLYSEAVFHSGSTSARLRSLRAVINIHTPDYSLAKHYRR